MPIRHEPASGAARERAIELDDHIDRLTGTGARPEGRRPSRRSVHRILACIAGSADDAFVESWTRDLGRLFAADVTLLHVTRPVPPVAIYPGGPMGFGAPVTLPIPDEAAQRAHAERLLQEAREHVAQDLPDVAILHREGHPGDEIVRAARELATDLVIMGHHEGGALDRLLVGSTTDHVKNHTQADVLIVRASATPGPILAGVDGSAPSREAAQLADEIARRWSTDLHLLYVVPKARAATHDDAVAEELHARALATGTTSPLDGVEMDLRLGDPRDALRLAARGMDASLIALGSRGLSGLRSLMPGSVSNALAHASPASVLLVRDDGT